MSVQHTRRTKVVKSFEGSALTPDGVAKAAAEQLDVLRVVWTADRKVEILEFVKAVRAHRSVDRELPVMLDVASLTQGTIAGLSAPRSVAFGDRLTVSASASVPCDLQLNTEYWSNLFTVAARVFIGPGNAVLRVLETGAKTATLEVTQGGTIYPDMEISVPETRLEAGRGHLSLEACQDVLAEGVDYLLVPGQWSKARLEETRKLLLDHHGANAPWLMVKIDGMEVVERLRDLLSVVDGVLISRREMSRTLNPATVPMITKEILQLCSDQAKVVVTASEMLASMRRQATPTRAEVSDVANAVLDGTDAVVLSEEVASGKFGSQAVEVMDRIIGDIEESAVIAPNWAKNVPTIASEMDAVAYHAYRTAERVNAKAIVCITKAGNTALKLASFQPPLPIVAVTFDAAVARRLAIVRGVEALLLDVAPNLDEVLPVVNDRLTRSSWLKPGDPIIFVAITLSPVGRESSNLFTVQYIA